MKKSFLRKTRVKVVVIGFALTGALVAALVVAGIYIEQVRSIEPYKILVARNNGRMSVISHLPSLAVGLSFERENIEDARPPDDLEPVLRELKSWDAVTHLSVGWVKDDEFDEIVEFPNLTSLGLFYTAISDGKWPELDRLSKLKHLTVWHTKITPSAANSIAGLKHLQFLSFSDFELTADDLGFVAGLRELYFVRFSEPYRGRPFGKGDLAALAGLPVLSFLALQDTPLVDGALMGLSEARSLRQLEIVDGRINSDDLTPLALLPKLGSLNLNNTGITNDALSTLKGSRSLEVLEIRDNPIDAIGLQSLRGIPSLKEIYVSSHLYGDAKRVLPGVQVN